MPYTVEPLTRENFTAVKSLHRVLYPKAPPFLEETFFPPTAGEYAIGWLAYSPAGHPSAYYGVFPTRLTNPLGRSVRAAQSGATMTHPEHQGQGLFTKLAERTYESARDSGVDFVFGFPNQNSYPGFTRKLKWQHHRTMVSHTVLADIKGAVRSFGRGTSFKARPIRSGEALQNSANEARGRVDRDLDFSVAKTHVTVFETAEYLAYVKVGSATLSVGDLIPREGTSLSVALQALRLDCARIGRPGLRFHVSPGAELDRALWGHSHRRAGLPYGYRLLGSENPDEFDFTWLDYDTF